MKVNTIIYIFLKFQKNLLVFHIQLKTIKKWTLTEMLQPFFALQEMLRVAHSESQTFDKIGIYYA